MVDFKRLGTATGQGASSSLLETFGRLDRQVSHVELRPSQIRALELLDSRIADRDVVVKLNTGGGKTVIGLLYLKHQMDRLKTPVVYLVPTIQLSEQVVREERSIGIAVAPWASGESYPPESAMRCESVIVCTYDKFFNGKSVFARHDVQLVPSSIVFDDVHAGIESVRSAFSCGLPSACRNELLDLLAPTVRENDPVAWAGMESPKSQLILEVPFWILAANLRPILEILVKYADSDEMRFAWPNVSHNIETARMFFSSSGAFLTIDPPAVERISHFQNAKHRLFMSASVHDGAVLIRELGCDRASVEKPVEVGSETAVGERMIIVPSLINAEFSHEELVQVALSTKQVANVVVLVSAFAQAESWVNAGATLAKAENITSIVAMLRTSPRGNLVVLAQRFDGLDLPDQSCRLLIIDGLPQGDNIGDRHDMSVVGGISGMRGKVANRIEQGLGRAVRSASDYCVAILAGRDLAAFVARASSLSSMTPQTVKQLEIGKVVSEALVSSPDRVKAVVETIGQSLRRDPDWKGFYLSQMTSAANLGVSLDQIAARRGVAQLERTASRHGAVRNFAAANSDMRDAVALSSGDLATAGILKQTAAKYQYHFDKAGAMAMQVSAYTDNRHVSRPPALVPSQVRRLTTQAESICEWLRGFADPNGALIELSELKAALAFANRFSDVEAALESLGRTVGAEASRPEREFNRGPDVLWIFGNTAFIIEAKSEKAAKLYKSDAEQLQSSMLWVKESYPMLEKRFGVIASNATEADVAGDFAFGAQVWTEADVISIVDRLSGLAKGVAHGGPLFSTSASNVQAKIAPNELTPGQLSQIGVRIR